MEEDELRRASRFMHNLKVRCERPEVGKTGMIIVRLACHLASSELGDLVEVEPWAARKQLGTIAIADVAKEVRADLGAGEELRIDLGVAEVRHTADVENSRSASS
jgi:hypothetical protein